MLRWTERVRPLMLPLILVAATLSPEVPGSTAAERGDTGPEMAVLIAAVEGALAARSGLTRVDPSLMAISDRRIPSVADYRSRDPEFTAAFVAHLEQLQVDTARAFPRIEGCTGGLVPPPFKRTDGCPEVPVSILVFDLPERPRPGRWTVRLVDMGYTPEWSMITIMEVMVAEEDGQMRYVEEKPLLVIE